MLDLNITLLFQLANFLIALIVLNELLIRPIRQIIRQRRELMDGMRGEAEKFEDEAVQRLEKYEAALVEARRDAARQCDAGRAAGAAEQQQLVSEAQKKAQEILAQTRRELEAEARDTLAALRGQVSALSARTAEKVLQLTREIVEGERITCLMITHNLKNALELGSRTFMMDSGRIVLDIKGEERRGLTVEDLLARFRSGAGRDLDNDRILLSND